MANLLNIENNSYFEESREGNSSHPKTTLKKGGNAFEDKLLIASP